MIYGNILWNLRIKILVPLEKKLNCPFVFQKCLFISKKGPTVFQSCPLVFQKCLLFICCVRLFPRILFSQLIVPSPRPAQRDNICLGLVLFPLGSLYWLNYDASLLKTSTWSMTFYVFYSNFSLDNSYENAVSQHLEWLKFPAPKHPLGRLQHPQTFQLYHRLSMAVRK